jgi:hypothetical protein
MNRKRVVSFSVSLYLCVLTRTYDRVLNPPAEFVFAKAAFVQIDHHVNRELAWLVEESTTVTSHSVHFE